MTILNGVEALLSTDGNFYTEFKDERVMRTSTNNGITLVLESKNTAEVKVSLNLRLASAIDVDYHSLGFLLSIDDQVKSFRSYEATDLAAVQFKVISHEDGGRNQVRKKLRPLCLGDASGCTVDLKVFRMDPPNVMRKYTKERANEKNAMGKKKKERIRRGGWTGQCLCVAIRVRKLPRGEIHH